MKGLGSFLGKKSECAHCRFLRTDDDIISASVPWSAGTVISIALSQKNALESEQFLLIFCLELQPPFFHERHLGSSLSKFSKHALLLVARQNHKALN